ncbi:hypothetical protein BJV82DRAFT_599184 [Fennellomyces sp. T-0311]|nr:hypothetical protein BJV82DRAFT_599184 [Fennellomyces sp. T-0311]
MFGYRSLQTVSMIPTLKHLDIHLTPLIQDDQLLTFIQALGETSAIEKFKLSNTASLTFDMLDALAEFPFLKLLSFEWCQNQRFSPTRKSLLTQVCKDGLHRLLQNSPSLENLSFTRMKVKDGDTALIYDQFSALVTNNHGGNWKFNINNYKANARTFSRAMIYRQL